jgi:hypothetical protein
MKASKDSAESSLSLASTSARLASKEVEFKLDGAGSKASLKAGSQQLDDSDSDGYSFTTKKKFTVSADSDVELNGSQISLLKGKVKFSDSSIDASASGTVSISGSMVKIG